MRLLLKILLLVILFAVSVAVGLFAGSAGRFFPAVLPAAFLLCALSYALAGALRLKSSVQLHGRTFLRGDSAGGALTLHNRSPFPLSAVTVTAAVIQPGGEIRRVTQTLSFAPGQARQLALPIAFAHVGRSRILLERLSVRDLSGLFALPAHRCAALEILAAPRLWPDGALTRLHTRDEDDSIFSAQSGGQGGQYDGVRQYAPGDPLHGIHWKLTAHTGHLMSRTYERPTQRAITVAADLSPQAGTPAEFDRLTEEPLGAALAALENGLDVTVLYADADGTHAFHPTSKKDLDTLGKRWAAGGPLPADGLDAVLRSTRADGILLCTARLTDRLTKALLAQRQAGAELALLWVTNTTDAAARLAPLAAAGVDCRTLPITVTAGEQR